MISLPFPSREKKRAKQRADAFFGEKEKDWNQFLEDAKRKSFSKVVQQSEQSDDKLKRHVDQMNRLATGREIGDAPGGRPYKIIRLRGGGLGCTCADWRYKQSVSTGDQECKHIRQFKQDRPDSLFERAKNKLLKLN